MWNLPISENTDASDGQMRSSSACNLLQCPAVMNARLCEAGLSAYGLRQSMTVTAIAMQSAGHHELGHDHRRSSISF